MVRQAGVRFLDGGGLPPPGVSGRFASSARLSAAVGALVSCANSIDGRQVVRMASATNALCMNDLSSGGTGANYNLFLALQGISFESRHGVRSIRLPSDGCGCLAMLEFKRRESFASF
jgi:hypothetical protein